MVFFLGRKKPNRKEKALPPLKGQGFFFYMWIRLRLCLQTLRSLQALQTLTANAEEAGKTQAEEQHGARLRGGGNV